MSVYNFQTLVATQEDNIYYLHFVVPNKIYDKLTKGDNKRVIVQINNGDSFRAGLLPNGKGGWFVMLSKDKLKKFKLEVNQKIDVEIQSDNSKYGMEMPEEFEELLAQDPEGEKHFEALTPGKKRSLIYIVAKLKNVDKRITKSLIILDHLKINDGKIDYKLLNQAFKDNNKFF